MVAACALWIIACDPAPRPGPEPPPRRPPNGAPAASAAAEETVAACPTDMVLVDGSFCPAADERCKRHLEEYESDPDKSERCASFEEPSRCASKRRTVMRFCVDRYEWPNQKEELPKVLVAWTEAKSACESVNKRLCDADEWLFACEGENMVPYVYGYERDDTACVIDRPWVSRPAAPLDRWDACMMSPPCRRAFEKLDQRAPSGSFTRCVSPFGAYDMNGNVNEWVNLPGESFPRRSGLKGGWWGPVRNRCRPTVRFHDESDWGYEIGFRCCRDAKP